MTLVDTRPEGIEQPRLPIVIADQAEMPVVRKGQGAEQDPSQIPIVLASLRGTAMTALSTLEEMRRASQITETAKTCAGIYSEDQVRKAQIRLLDLGLDWRRETDSVAYEIARQFPDTCIKAPFFDSESVAHISDGKRLYRVEQAVSGDLEVRVYNSLPTQGEMNAGIKLATPEMWEQMLSHIALRQEIPGVAPRQLATLACSRFLQGAASG